MPTWVWRRGTGKFGARGRKRRGEMDCRLRPRAPRTSTFPDPRKLDPPRTVRGVGDSGCRLFPRFPGDGGGREDEPDGGFIGERRERERVLGRLRVGLADD